MKINEYDLKKLESYWSDIDKLKKDLRYREWELMNPHQEQDSNIGGGRSSNISDTTFQKASALLEDKQYNNLKNIVETIESIYPELDDDQKKIVQMRYWDKQECYEWQHIGDELYMSVQRVLRKRNKLIDDTAKRLGWV